ncbi:MAG: hypothetical protein JWL86_4586 [Rhizobium sp.]|nr:hypothetical protein [Rhizobium sp.]
MNKITRKHYPVSKLPEELKKEFEAFETVTLVGERGQSSGEDKSDEKSYHSYEEMMAGIKPMTWKELYADRQANPEKYSRGVTAEEAVARIRALRDEWDSDR